MTAREPGKLTDAEREAVGRALDGTVLHGTTAADDQPDPTRRQSGEMAAQEPTPCARCSSEGLLHWRGLTGHEPVAPARAVTCGGCGLPRTECTCPPYTSPSAYERSPR